MECESESLRKVQSIVLWAIFYSLLFQVYFVVGTQQWNETTLLAESPAPNPSSFCLQVDALKDGSFHATVFIGLGQYFLDVDTGSDLTWITCSPTNIKFLQPSSIHRTPHAPYTTHNNLVSCTEDAICALVEKPNPQCSQQNQQCDYKVEYADHGTSLSVLVKDTFRLRSSLKRSRTVLGRDPTLIFGCGYHQEFDPSSPPLTDGVLGLGTGNTSILSQLSDKGLIKKVIALCLSRDGPGYLVLGDSKSNLPETVWMPLLKDPPEPYNMLGPADILYQGNPLASGVLFLFDSGTTFNYFNVITFQPILSKVTQLVEKIATPIQDPFLHFCWKPSGSSNDFLGSFSSLNLSLTGNSVLLKLVIYDYEKTELVGIMQIAVIYRNSFLKRLALLHIQGEQKWVKGTTGKNMVRWSIKNKKRVQSRC